MPKTYIANYGESYYHRVVSAENCCRVFGVGNETRYTTACGKKSYTPRDVTTTTPERICRACRKATEATT